MNFTSEAALSVAAEAVLFPRILQPSFFQQLARQEQSPELTKLHNEVSLLKQQLAEAQSKLSKPLVKAAIAAEERLGSALQAHPVVRARVLSRKADEIVRAAEQEAGRIAELAARYQADLLDCVTQPRPVSPFMTSADSSPDQVKYVIANNRPWSRGAGESL
jgi:cell division septum initiation protein DivIVA